MLTQNISITEAARNFSDFVNRVAYRRESFFLIRGKKPVAELRPIVAGRRMSELASLIKSLPKLSALELNTLNKDLTSIRHEGLRTAKTR